MQRRIRIRDENAVHALKDTRPLKRPRNEPVATKAFSASSLLPTQAKSRAALADVSNKGEQQQQGRIKRPGEKVPSKLGLSSKPTSSLMAHIPNLGRLDKKGKTQQDSSVRRYVRPASKLTTTSDQSSTQSKIDLQKAKQQYAALTFAPVSTTAVSATLFQKDRTQSFAFQLPAELTVAQPQDATVPAQDGPSLSAPGASAKNISLSELVSPMENLTANDSRDSSSVEEMSIGNTPPSEMREGETANVIEREQKTEVDENHVEGESIEGESTNDDSEEEDEGLEEIFGDTLPADTDADDAIFDIDSVDSDDPQMVTAYCEDIFNFLRDLETSSEMPDPNYMKAQRQFTHKMRGVLVDWMIDVSTQFGLLSETSFLAVNLLDRLCTKKEISKNRLQLAGVTALVLASKYEETRMPYLDDFVWVAADAFTREDIIKLEKIMLGVLHYNLGLPNPLAFLRRFSKAARADSRTHTLSKYLCEYTLPAYSMLAFKPSMIAAASVYLARKMSQKTPLWTKTLQHYTSYREEELVDCARQLNQLRLQPTEPLHFAAVNAKYGVPLLFSVSELPALAEAAF